MVEVLGFEPRLLSSKDRVLPLHYTSTVKTGTAGRSRTYIGHFRRVLHFHYTTAVYLRLVNNTMKVAIMISGRPRFTREFDDFLNSLSNYDQLDWYFMLWNTTHEEDVRVPPTWPTDYDAVKERIQSKLPRNSNIVHLSIEEPPAYDDTQEFRLTPWSIAPHIWTMYYGIYMVNQIREQYGPYDLVIRTRPDIGIAEKLNLPAIYQSLIANVNTVLMPSNHRHSMAGPPVNDLFGIALPDTMTLYSQAFTRLEEFKNKQLPFHGETVLSWHLATSNIHVPDTNFHSVMRLYTNHGGPHDGDSSVDYGRWN